MHYVVITYQLAFPQERARQALATIGMPRLFFRILDSCYKACPLAP